MRIAVIVVRVLFGLLLIATSVMVLFKLVPQPEPQGAVKTFMLGMQASVYILPLVKVIELICGILLVAGFFVPLATVVIFPISVNILLFHIFVNTEGLPIALFVILCNLFLAFAYRKNYEGVLAMK